MAKQTFTTGQVLTAAQMNSLQANDYNWTTSAQTASYVLTAANAGQTVTMTNAAATTITVNTGLFSAGDTVRIINLGAGTTTITAGTATVSSAGSLALPQYASGTLWFSSASAAIFIPDDRNTGLTLIKTQTIGSAVSTVTVTNAFSATYDNYKIVVSGGTGSANTYLKMTLGATTTGYYWAYLFRTYAGTSGGDQLANGAFWLAGTVQTNGLKINMEIQNPFASTVTGFQNVYDTPATGGDFDTGGGYLNNTTSYTDFTLAPNTGTITGGTIRVYGYQNS